MQSTDGLCYYVAVLFKKKDMKIQTLAILQIKDCLLDIFSDILLGLNSENPDQWIQKKKKL